MLLNILQIIINFITIYILLKYFGIIKKLMLCLCELLLKIGYLKIADTTCDSQGQVEWITETNKILIYHCYYGNYAYYWRWQYHKNSKDGLPF